ncbi:MAG: RsmE family RNA methyltransferase [Candidatus Omnitrophota bacterium]
MAPPLPVMNLILLFPSDFIPGTNRVVLAGRRHAHVTAVHRAVAGDVLAVGFENGQMGQGVVFRLTGSALEMDVVLTEAPPAKIPVILAVALIRPPVFRRVLQTAAAMGVEAIHVFHACRVEKSFWLSTALKESDVREQVILGLEQARDTILPEVVFHPSFRLFSENVLPVLLKGRTGFVGDPSGGKQDIFLPGPKVLVIGPEGGFIPRELDAFASAGYAAIGLGPRILRVETAVAAFLSRFV